MIDAGYSSQHNRLKNKTMVPTTLKPWNCGKLVQLWLVQYKKYQLWHPITWKICTLWYCTYFCMLTGIKRKVVLSLWDHFPFPSLCEITAFCIWRGFRTCLLRSLLSLIFSAVDSYACATQNRARQSFQPIQLSLVFRLVNPFLQYYCMPEISTWNMNMIANIPGIAAGANAAVSLIPL